tara:strand:+ start:220 stop:564 length:345 start_codon:yes stop_codon:yes gene_type:complete
MGVKAELLKKEVTLITLSQNHKLEIKKFDECYFFRGTYSIRGSKITYYCKSEDYYAKDYYALVLNKDKIKDAISDLFKNKIEILNTSLEYHIDAANDLEYSIHEYKKLRDENNY